MIDAKEILSIEVDKLNNMLENIEQSSNEEILKQSQLVDKLIIKYMRESEDMRWKKQNGNEKNSY